MFSPPSLVPVDMPPKLITTYPNLFHHKSQREVHYHVLRLIVLHHPCLARICILYNSQCSHTHFVNILSNNGDA